MRLRLLLFTLLSLTSLSAQIRVNVGGPQFTDISGNVWAADNGCTSDSTYTYAGAISGTPNSTLYQTGRTSVSTLNCTYTVPANSYYAVTLKFAEYQTKYASNGNGNQRLMNIKINNVQYYTAFDVYRTCGFAAACDISPNPIPVNSSSTGQISITITQQQGQPMLSALEIDTLNLPLGFLTLSGIPSSGEVPTATSGTTASWQYTGVGVVADVRAFGAVADSSSGTNGADQLALINSAAAAIPATGGTLVFPPNNGACFAISSTIQLHSNTTAIIQPGACVRMLHGNIGTTIVGGPIFRAGLVATTNSNIWVGGGGFLDGNKSNITGTGDQFNQGVDFQSCTNCGLQTLTIKNTWTDGFSVNCGSNTPGNNVQIVNVVVTDSRRNGGSNSCGTNTQILNSSLLNSGGGSLSEGFDNEPFSCSGSGNAPGCNGITTGITLENVIITGNASGCINYIGPYDTNPTVTIKNVQCNAPVNTTGALLVQDNGSVGNSVLNITDSSFISSGGGIALAFENFALQNIAGVIAAGGADGIFIGVTFSTPLADSFTYITNSYMSGSSYDISNVGFTTLVNSTLKNGTINSYAHSLSQVVSVEPGWCSPVLGLPAFVQGNNSNLKLNCTTHVVANDSATNPAYGITDGTNSGAIALINDSGDSIYGGSTNAIPACWGANNIDAASGGLQGGLCITADGINAYAPGSGTYANNAAAAAAGLPIGTLYHLTGSDTPGMVHSGSSIGGPITALTGDVIVTGPGSVTATLASVGSAGSCGDATHSCSLTFDAKGREIARTNNTISSGLLTGGSAPLGGSALLAGVCSTTTVAVSGAIVGNAVIATPETYPGDAFYWRGYVSSADVVTVDICAATAGTPTSSIYVVRVAP